MRNLGSWHATEEAQGLQALRAINLVHRPRVTREVVKLLAARHVPNMYDMISPTGRYHFPVRRPTALYEILLHTMLCAGEGHRESIERP